MTEQEFNEKNKRRIEIIDQMHAGFTEEERMRPFASNPGWKEECDRREHANLTDEERAELERLQDEVGDYLAEKFPHRDPIKELLARPNLSPEIRAELEKPQIG